METQEIRTLIHDIKELSQLDRNEIKEVVQKMKADEIDFEVGAYRFIYHENILDIMVEELERDEYVLGCFNDGFLADIMKLPVYFIQAIQKDEGYAALGEYIINEGLTRELAEEYANADGYGNHFAHYDGETHELGNLFFAFRIN